MSSSSSELSMVVQERSRSVGASGDEAQGGMSKVAAALLRGDMRWRCGGYVVLTGREARGLVGGEECEWLCGE